MTTDVNAVERVNQYLNEQATLDTLRFITCGSVDDGKSTLIGRMLYEAQLIFEDQVASLQTDSKKMGTQGGEIDFALLVDGLASEREQGITIDVAYRFFATDRRKFIVADTPGHEQYTRNMVTGASTADVAVILIDALEALLLLVLGLPSPLDAPNNGTASSPASHMILGASGTTLPVVISLVLTTVDLRVNLLSFRIRSRSASFSLLTAIRHF